MSLTVSQIQDILVQEFGTYRTWLFTYQAGVTPLYTNLFDHTGYPLQFPYPVIMYILDDFEMYDQYYYNLEVFQNGLLVTDTSMYTIKRALGSHRIYFNVNKLKSGDKLEVVVEKYYRNDKYWISSPINLYSNSTYTLDTPLLSSAERFDDESDIMVFRKIKGGTYYKPIITNTYILDPTGNPLTSTDDFSIRKDNGNYGWNVTINQPLDGDTYYVASKRTFGSLHTTTPLPIVKGLTGFGQILPLYSGATDPSGNAIDPSLSNPVPLSFDVPDELEVYFNGKRAILNEHYKVIWNHSNYAVPPVLAFEGFFYDNIDVYVKTTNRGYDPSVASTIHLPTMSNTGIIDLGSFGIPIDLSYLDVYLSGKKLSSDQLEIICEEVLRVKNVDSLQHLVVRVVLPFSNELWSLKQQYQQATKSSLLTSIRQQGFETWRANYVATNNIPTIFDLEDMMDTDFFNQASITQDLNAEASFIDEYVNIDSDTLMNANMETDVAFEQDFRVDANAQINMTGVTTDEEVEGDID
jgi:hypothetical protein